MSLTQEEINQLRKYFMTQRFEYTISDLKSMAKKKNIKGYYRTNKVTLYLKLRDGMNEFDRFKFDWHIDNKTLRKSLEISLKNDSNESKENWVNFNRRYLCEHERYKYSCRLCKGKAICEHGKQKYYCKICVGSAICQHKRRRYLCKKCHGKGICEQGKQRPFCYSCGGVMIGKNGRRKDFCKECWKLNIDSINI